MDQQSSLPANNDTLLPKLIKDKINDYKTIEQVNSTADEMFEKIKTIMEYLDGNVVQISGGNYNLQMCYGYDLIEGKKKYCLKTTIDQGKKQDIFQCFNCEVERLKSPSYCIKHSKGYLYFNTDEILCQDCVDRDYPVEDLSTFFSSFQ